MHGSFGVPPAMHLHLNCLSELTLGQGYWRANPLLLLFPHNVDSPEIHILILTRKTTSEVPMTVNTQGPRHDVGSYTFEARDRVQF